jgi:hypothetical protein
VRLLLRSAAREDAFTGPVPNPDWGAGKLDLRRLVEVVNEAFIGGRHERASPTIGIPPPRRCDSAFTPEWRSHARLEIYSVDGRRIFEREIGPIPLGVTEVKWAPSTLARASTSRECEG